MRSQRTDGARWEIEDPISKVRSGESMRHHLSGSLGKAEMAKSKERLADLPALSQEALGRRLGKPN
eukprot:551824-Heterocapsa_arctica.AAC.1